MKVALYARVSTVDKGQDPELQLRPMREYCERMGWQCKEFVDWASGKDLKRPALTEMMNQIKSREYDCLMVWKLDRLARSLINLIDIVYGELHPRHIEFICLTQQMDTTTPTGRLLFGILGSLSEFEHDLTGERVKEGMALAKAKGIRLGRRRVIDDGVRGKRLLGRILDAYSSGLGIRGTARKMVMPPGTVYNILKREGALNK